MKHWDCEKVENCFVKTQTYAYLFAEPVTEEFLERIKGDGELRVMKNFRRPCYFLDRKYGADLIRIKGILNHCQMKVSFPDDGWEASKTAFENGLCALADEAEQETVMGDTESVCPVCLERIPARKIRRLGRVYLDKTCPAHGAFSVCVWEGQIPYESWNRPKHSSNVNAAVLPAQGCPYDCGLCTEHRQKTCCVLLEVTTRCNLECPVCFASAGAQGEDLPLDEIEKRFAYLMEQGGPFNVQLSGGEPTLRDDLDQIIRIGKAQGIRFFQLNTNGIRLAQEPEYAGRLAAAGLNCVFLQFDGMDDAIYETLRGRTLLEVKKQAIRVCRELNLGVVLVPVIAKGVNENSIGAILDFALSEMPAVRGVHFQPLSYFGRYDRDTNAGHVTLPELLAAIEQQTGGRMKQEDFSPGNAENPYCSMSGNFSVQDDRSLKAWPKAADSGCCQTGEAPELSDQAREFVARQWSGGWSTGDGADVTGGAEETGGAKAADGAGSCCHCNSATASLDQYIETMRKRTLAVSAMVFMDAHTLDLERLRQCYIHVITRRDGLLSLIPFCAYNLTSDTGETLYRR